MPLGKCLLCYYVCVCVQTPIKYPAIERNGSACHRIREVTCTLSISWLCWSKQEMEKAAWEEVCACVFVGGWYTAGGRWTRLGRHAKNERNQWANLWSLAKNSYFIALALLVLSNAISYFYSLPSYHDFVGSSYTTAISVKIMCVCGCRETDSYVAVCLCDSKIHRGWAVHSHNLSC